VSTSAVLAPLAASSPTAPPAAGRLRAFVNVYLPPLLVLVTALVVAGVDYGRFLQHHRHLWTGTIHDRHAHYLTALSLSLDVRHGDVRRFLHDFDGARVWPPLHAFLAAAVLTVGGDDYRLAVLPSLAAWVGTVLLGFLVARRATSRGGNVAGLAAALLLLASGAHRAFATDVMLESLGACLSLLGLYLYLVTVQGTSPRAGRWLGLALTALFLAKYNYWMLVVFAILAAEITTRPRIYRTLLADAVTGIDWRGLLAAEVRRPLNYLLAAILAVLAYVLATGGTTLALGGQRVSLRSPHNLVHAAYAVVLLRLALAWQAHRAAVLKRLDPRARPLIAWHLWPLAVWFLLPKRLSYFLWYLSPAQAGEHPQYGLEHSTRFYWSCFVQDYSRGLGMALLVVALVGAAVLAVRRLRPGGRALLFFVLIAVALSLNHPNRKSRFLHSWVAGAWAAAGVGLACLLHGRLTRRVASARPWLSAAALGGLGVVCLPTLADAGRAPEGGPQPQRPSSLVLTDCYTEHLAGARQPLVLSNLPMKFLCQWTLLERFGHAARIDTDIRGFGTVPEEDRASFQRWLTTSRSDVVVYIDIHKDSCFYEEVPGCEPAEALRDLLEAQSVLPLKQRWHLPEYGCTISLWARPDAGRP